MGGGGAEGGGLCKVTDLGGESVQAQRRGGGRGLKKVGGAAGLGKRGEGVGG